ncbi:MAG: glucans biosynthesis glucosyltransferase MdoH [Ancalomicrobiaceae bacterium]|nr:glucans biosynthesis glucosyltransferase MdoH [Ancalomicrobiaceae bacterium]
MSDELQAAIEPPSLVSDPAIDGLTPTGTQSLARLNRRRLLVAALNLVTLVLLTTVFCRLAGHGGWTPLDVALVVAFVVSSPWNILSLWNAVIGFLLMHGGRNAIREVYPYALKAGEADPVTARIAVIMTLRNEDPVRALQRLRLVRKGLEASGYGERFAYFVLSDTNRPEIASAEEAAFADEVAAAGDHVRLSYRRRDDNAGFKAGNIRDFLDTWGDGYDLMLGLDADSLMGAPTILRLIRIMQANPKLGILQSLVVGLPSRSAFARLFQFGMRHNMRIYTMGAAWWAGDCGPYWGHNAVIRVAPFKAHCRLPVIPGKPPLGGPVLSHDQLEAAFMRRAGYEVRVLPEECQSYEENPPHLNEFTRRDLRWCQGNMQYWRFLLEPGLKPLSRFQIAWAILLYFGSFGWMAFVVLAMLTVFEVKPTSEPFPVGLGIALFIGMTVMSLMPKLAGIADALLSRREARRYGGWPKLLASAAVELLFSMLISPAVAFRVAIFMLGLPFGRTATWDGQKRDAERLSWRTALVGLWPQMLFAILMIAVLGPLAIWGLPMVLGLLLAIPLAVVTAEPAVGDWCRTAGLCVVPEEVEMPEDVAEAIGWRPATPLT